MDFESVDGCHHNDRGGTTGRVAAAHATFLLQGVAGASAGEAGRLSDPAHGRGNFRRGACPAG
jgi:hypothetical protein